MSDRGGKRTTKGKSPAPDLVQVDPDFAPEELRLRKARNPFAQSTIGDVGVTVQVDGPERFPETVLRLPITPEDVTGIDPTSVRVFRVDKDARRLRALWSSGFNQVFGYAFAPIRRPGTYVALGLPRDPLLREVLRALARERRLRDEDDDQDVTKRVLLPLVEGEQEEMGRLRAALALAELEAGLDPLAGANVEIGGDGAVVGFPLPGGTDLAGLRKRLSRLDVLPGGLPEEELFFPPDLPWQPLPWPPRPRPTPPEVVRIDSIWFDRLRFIEVIKDFWKFLFCFLGGRNWWMYQHDAQHTGRAVCSSIASSNAWSLGLKHKVALDGPIITQPVVVDGKIYVGIGNNSTTGVAGTLYRIDLATGAKEDQFSFSGVGSRQGYAGVGGSPAVVGGRVYFSALTGKLYCLNASSFALQWATDLRHTDLAHNQPVEHGGAAKSEGWSSPLVVNGRVYVGFGEGEDPDGVAARYGFVYCLDAASGNVVWLFCTNHFGGGDNDPNVIPPAAFAGVPPAPFTKAANNPVNTGAAPWSSAAYDAGLDRIYIGTGNAKPDDPLPDPKYASGMLSLFASTGEFKKFFQPAKSDNYRPDFDNDVDVPGGPTVFSRDGQRVVGIGTKGGSYFILHADSLAVLHRRQLLPYDSGGNPFPAIDPPAGPGIRENRYGMFGTAAIHPGLERLFVPFGGYSSGIDTATTPFMRALDWSALNDAWLTAGTNPPKYTVPVPPMYLTPGEAGLSSPAVVNDVVFVSTTKPALYGLRATDGLCLWAAPGFGPGTYCVGPAVHGSYVVAGTGSNLYIYSL